MRKRFKIVLNLEIEDPDEPFPVGGYYAHMSRLQGLIHGILHAAQSFWGLKYTITLDKIIDKGEIKHTLRTMGKEALRQYEAGETEDGGFAIEEPQMSVAEIMSFIALEGLHAKNFEMLVPQMLRAICKDEHIDAMEKFVKLFDEIEWNWYPNG